MNDYFSGSTTSALSRDFDLRLGGGQVVLDRRSITTADFDLQLVGRQVAVFWHIGERRISTADFDLRLGGRQVAVLLATWWPASCSFPVHGRPYNFYGEFGLSSWWLASCRAPVHKRAYNFYGGF
jgi:hypothetical protein